MQTFVLSRSVTTPPDPADPDPSARPNFGDAYLVQSGSWSIPINSIAVWSALGAGSWQAIPPTYGVLLYIRDEPNVFVYWTGSAWSDTPWRQFDAASIPRSAFVWSGAVINQTTDAPPASPSVGAAYIVGPSPSGAWTGSSGFLAICETAGAFVLYPPTDGLKVYDLALKLPYRWSSSLAQWITDTGAMKCVLSIYGANAVFTKDPRCIGIDVSGVAGGAGDAGNGGLTAFGAHASATGGTTRAGTGGQLGGVGTGGDMNYVGGIGFITAAGDKLNGLGGGPDGGTTYGRGGDGQPGGGAFRLWIVAANVLVNETVTVGAAGADGGSVIKPTHGALLIWQWIAI